jgi:hypothetical protein
VTPRAQAAIANVAGGQFTVTPENVLGIYGAILQEVTRLQAALAHFQRQYGEGMPLLGGDPVSKPAKDAFDASTIKLVHLAQVDINNFRLRTALVTPPAPTARPTRRSRRHSTPAGCGGRRRSRLRPAQRPMALR